MLRSTHTPKSPSDSIDNNTNDNTIVSTPYNIDILGHSRQLARLFPPTCFIASLCHSGWKDGHQRTIESSNRMIQNQRTQVMHNCHFPPHTSGRTNVGDFGNAARFIQQNVAKLHNDKPSVRHVLLSRTPNDSVCHILPHLRYSARSKRSHAGPSLHGRVNSACTAGNSTSSAKIIRIQNKALL